MQGGVQRCKQVTAGKVSAAAAAAAVLSLLSVKLVQRTTMQGQARLMAMQQFIPWCLTCSWTAGVETFCPWLVSLAAWGLAPLV
jgi:hypothetical protein